MFLRIKLSAKSFESDSGWTETYNDSCFYFENGQGDFISLKKRNKYPVSFAKKINDTIVMGYGKPTVDISQGDDGSIEFLLIELDTKNNSLQVTRDIFCTLPLFVSYSTKQCTLSDDLGFVKDNLKDTSVDMLVLYSLLVDPKIDNRTLLHDISLLGSASILTWSAKQQTLIKNKIIIDKNKVGLSSRNFGSLLQKTIETYISRLDDDTKIAFEVSGGIDSSTAPLVLNYTKKLAPNMVLAPMDFTGDFGFSQRKKLDDLADVTGLSVIRVGADYDRNYPLSRFFTGNFSPAFFYQYQEIYSEILNELAASLAREGFDIVFTGIGGDELFENILPVGSVDVNIPHFYHSQKLDYLRDTVSEKSEQELITPAIADSAYFAGVSRNNIYIQNDIWPVSPLADPFLYFYCKELPIELRANKNILRAYHSTIGSPVLIYNPKQNEHFGEYFETSISKHLGNMVESIGKTSWLEKQGILKWKDVADASGSITKTEQPDPALLFSIYRLLTAEIILQSL